MNPIIDIAFYDEKNNRLLITTSVNGKTNADIIA